MKHWRLTSSDWQASGWGWGVVREMFPSGHCWNTDWDQTFLIVLGVSIVWAVRFKISLRGVCLFVNINVLKFHSGFFVYVLGCQGVEFNCHPLGVRLRFGTGHFIDISVPLFLTAPRGAWDLSPPARDWTRALGAWSLNRWIAREVPGH